MTFVISHPHEARTFQSGLAATALARLAAAWRRYDDWRRQYDAARAIESLPADLRKDLGWPAPASSQNAARPRLARP